MTPKRLVALACGLNLLTGVAIGVVIDRQLGQRAEAAATAGSGTGSSAATSPPTPDAGASRPSFRGGPGGPGGSARFLSMIAKELELTEEQIAATNAIFERRRSSFEAAFAKVRPELERLREEGEAEFEALLTDVQRTKMADMKERWEKSRAESHARREKRRAHRSQIAVGAALGGPGAAALRPLPPRRRGGRDGRDGFRGPFGGGRDGADRPSRDGKDDRNTTGSKD